MFIYLMNVFFNNFFFAELLLMAPVIFDIQENYIVPQNAVFIINTQNKSMQGKKLHKRLSFICLFIYIVSRFITRAVCRFYQNKLIQKLWYSFSRFLFVQKNPAKMMYWTKGKRPLNNCDRGVFWWFLGFFFLGGGHLLYQRMSRHCITKLTECNITFQSFLRR